jgi:hypothetical protein
MTRFVRHLSVWLLACAMMASGQDRKPGDPPPNDAWKISPQFQHDVFTFARLRPQHHPDWDVDFPDSDLNFPYRLQQLTALETNPQSRLLSILDPDLRNYPFTYIVEPGVMQLTDQEAQALRAYLLDGGCLMLDDFWGDAEWANVYENLKRIFPDREPQELELDHPIFHSVFDLSEKPQIPSISIAMENRHTGQFWEKGGIGAHYYGIFDDKGRMMVIVCRNTDLGDGWEEEGVDPWYFEEFSKKRAYPMGINIIFYLLTN